MQIPSSKFQDWKAAENELADIERTFRALSADLSPTDRERVTRQLAALKAARLRVLLLFVEVKKETASMAERLADVDQSESPPRDRPKPSSRVEDWLS